MRTQLIAFLSGILLGSGVAPAQNLRRAVAAADLVLVGTSVRVIPAKNHVIHRIEVEEVLRAPDSFDRTRQVSVVVTKRVSAHNRPLPAKRMLYCVHESTAVLAGTGLPEQLAPYFKMSGYAGSAVVLDPKADDGDRADPRLELARVLVASQKGQQSRQTAEQLYRIALTGDPRVRTEAASCLSERPPLLSTLTDLHLGSLLSRATGETKDVAYKIALAGICATRRLPGLVETLSLSAEHVGDPSFLRAIGRYARFLHGDEADQVLTQILNRAKGQTRQRLIVALGATATKGALETLLKMHKAGTHQDAVEAALRFHGAPQALAALDKPKADSGGTGNAGKNKR